jgi:hypothetical protein
VEYIFTEIFLENLLSIHVHVFTKFYYKISSGQSDRHNKISACQNTKIGQSMSVTGRLFPGLAVDVSEVERVVLTVA